MTSSPGVGTARRCATRVTSTRCRCALGRYEACRRASSRSRAFGSSLAQATGVAVDTIRYYERQGLIDAPPRRGAEHRLYPPETVERLNLIRKTRQLGFALPVVRELIALLEAPAATTKAEMLLAEIEARLQYLTMLRKVVLRDGHGVHDAEVDEFSRGSHPPRPIRRAEAPEA